MAIRYWILGALTLAIAPAGCVITASTPDGSGGHTSTYRGTGGTAPSTVGGGGGGGAAATGDTCNPVTGTGCPADGSTCDMDSVSGYFTCFPPPNAVTVCGSCDVTAQFCGDRASCVIATGAKTGSCFRYCCTDSDCGTGATCNTALAVTLLNPSDPTDKVGFCVATGGAAACNPPPSVSSGGSCVGGLPALTDAGTVTPSPDGGGSMDAGSTDAGSTGPGSTDASVPSDAGSSWDGGHTGGGRGGHTDGGVLPVDASAPDSGGVSDAG